MVQVLGSGAFGEVWMCQAYQIDLLDPRNEVIYGLISIINWSSIFFTYKTIKIKNLAKPELGNNIQAMKKIISLHKLKKTVFLDYTSICVL